MIFLDSLFLCGLIAAVADATALPQQTSSASSKSTVCNNSPSLCNRAYNQITYMGAHDSAFLRDASTDNSISGDQFFNATDALDAGLRFLQAQVHDKSGTLELCHTSCDLLDAGSLEDWLKPIADWMNSHSSDVVTLLLVNSDSLDVARFGEAFTNSGLAKLAYQPPTADGPTGDWPTLGDMISKGTRVVSFVTNIDATPTYPFLLDEFDYVFETPFEVTSLQGFNCTLDRPSHEGSAANALSAHFLSLVNHFKYQSLGSLGDSSILLPDVSNINTVNSDSTSQDGQLGRHLQQCATEWGSKPNFVLVDFWNRGDTIKAADHQNGLTDTTGRSSAGTSSSDGGSDGSDDGGSMAARHTLNLGQAALLAFAAGAIVLT